MSDTVARVLAQIDADPDLPWSLRAEMCDLFHVSASTVSRWLNPDHSLAMDLEQVRVLSCHLDDVYGERRLAAVFHGKSSLLQRRPSGSTNQRIDDDIMAITQVLGHIADHYIACDQRAAKDEWHAGMARWADLYSELDEMG